MENMRWILLLAGIVIVLGIYIYGRLQGWLEARPDPSDARHEPGGGRDFDPLFDDPQEDEQVDAELEHLGQLIAEEAKPQHTVHTRTSPETEPPAEPEPPVEPEPPAKPAPASAPDRVISLFVLAPGGVPFRGTFLIEALEKAGLEYGDMQIFHRRERHSGSDAVLFSVANLVEPGTFDLSAMEHFTTRGLVLFLQLPGPFDAIRAFDAMVEAARSLADSLEGNVCDATRSVLTNQTIAHMREGVVDYQFRHRVAHKAS
jgi:cell division protein ZipA